MLRRLQGERSTLLLSEDGQGFPRVLHWGVRLPPFELQGEARREPMRDPAVPNNWRDHLQGFHCMFPTVGTGHYRTPAMLALRDGSGPAYGIVGTSLFDHEASLDIQGDSDWPVTVVLDMARDVLRMRTEFAVRTSRRFEIEHLASGVFILSSEASDLLTFGGRWGAEWVEHRIPLTTGAHTIENRRGRTSHDRFPLLIAGTAGFSEQRGEVWGVHLGWSGNHRTVAERLPDGTVQIVTGELLEPSEVKLGDGESLTTPTAYGAWSDEGLSGLARAYHAEVRRLLFWPGGEMTPRPVTLNTWEGTYFAHDEARLMRQATAAAALGIERFVLDDGWQNGRTSERAGLGDWVHDSEKYPNGLGPLARHVEKLGMQFGLWVEPEMANPDSDALRASPETTLRGDQGTARHQLVRDLTRPEIWDEIHAALDKLLRELPISYLKWDMNRDLTATGGTDGRSASRKQVLATYALMDRLRADHPHLEIESCASGGGRADLGVMARCHRVWTSDCTDALDRLRIQRGALRLLPPEILGAHVSASPNHQTGRRHTLAFRAAAALFFHFGIELDPLTLSADERIELTAWIVLHKKLRPLLHAGQHQACDPIDGRYVLGVTNPQEAAFLVTQERSPEWPIPPPLRLPGLDADATYCVTAPAPQTGSGLRLSETHKNLFAAGVSFNGAVLRQVGFTPPPLPPESALILHLTVEP